METKKKRKRTVKSLKTLVTGKNQYLDKLMIDSHFRILMTTVFGGGWNFVYAVYHLVLAAVFQSYWFFTMGIYYIVICGMRASALRLEKVNDDKSVEQKALRRNALLTFGLAVVFSGVVCLTIIEKKNMVYHIIVGISMAAYTFYCVTIAILNLIRLRRDKTVQKMMLRNCSMVYALGSLFGLERMMLVTFGNADARFILVMEASSGAGIFIIILLFGVNLLMAAAKITSVSDEL